ncbi:MAG TPA: hypothetical protein VJT67_08865 [Longimicrobiaceae bacterium]|nr:hypothetical protein [Longimicrobiaceae bacterium]
MADITRYSTRLMGFHLREYRSAEGDETEMFSARIYLGEAEAGMARNSGEGGPDHIYIHFAHRDAWDKFVQYMDEHPMAVREDGSSETYLDGEESALMLLRALHDAEQSLVRSRKYRSGLIQHVWERPFDGGGWWATAQVLLSAATTLPAEQADPGTFRVLLLGTDNERFAREEAPLPGRGAA